ncbi:hypothetical protein QJS66_14705 [Kocuria rhizophila]|nr:hypothetical protein QJS66_14705 [Kocuria rhizophila]
MTERLAGGATLVKLDSDPAEESREFAARARMSAASGPAPPCCTTFVTALTRVSARRWHSSTAWAAPRRRLGHLDAGSRRLARRRPGSTHRSPCSRRPHGHHDAAVSFERVFEVLDIKPLIAESPSARALPEGPGGRGVRPRQLLLPLRGEGLSLASLEDVAVLDSRGGEEVLHAVSFRAGPRTHRGARGLLRAGKPP